VSVLSKLSVGVSANPPDGVFTAAIIRSQRNANPKAKFSEKLRCPDGIQKLLMQYVEININDFKARILRILYMYIMGCIR